jgi:hypothetical protein
LKDAHTTTPLQLLLDIAYLVPPLMEQFDSIGTQTLDQNRSPESVPRIRSQSIQQILSRLLRSAQSILRRLKTWEAGLQNHDEGVQLFISRFSSWSNASRDQDESLCGKIFAVSYTFPSFELAAALVYHEAVKIFVLELIGDIKQYIENRLEGFSCSVAAGPNTMGKADDMIKGGIAGTTSEDISLRSVADLHQASLDAARQICSSLEYFFERDKKMIGRMVALFPFETAHRIFKKHGIAGAGNGCRRELLFCDMVNERLQTEGISTFAYSPM